MSLTTGTSLGPYEIVAASLELRKLYPAIEDGFAAQHQLIRVTDESGEDYLYPDDYFVRVELPKAIAQTLRRIA